jgi:hypothetical protein
VIVKLMWNLNQLVPSNPHTSVMMHLDRPPRPAFSERGRSWSNVNLTRSPSVSSFGSHNESAFKKPVILGVCAMDVKARSKAMREILTRLVERGRGSIEVKVFGDKVILDEGALQRFFFFCSCDCFNQSPTRGQMYIIGLDATSSYLSSLPTSLWTRLYHT